MHLKDDRRDGLRQLAYIASIRRPMCGRGPLAYVAVKGGGSNRRHAMNETCDRCGPTVRAVYSADRDGVLYLCGHCARRLGQALCAQGWTIWSVG